MRSVAAERPASTEAGTIIAEVLPMYLRSLQNLGAALLTRSKPKAQKALMVSSRMSSGDGYLTPVKNKGTYQREGQAPPIT